MYSFQLLLIAILKQICGVTFDSRSRSRLWSYCLRLLFQATFLSYVSEKFVGTIVSSHILELGFGHTFKSYLFEILFGVPFRSNF